MIRTKHGDVLDRLMRLSIYAAQLDLPFEAITFDQSVVDELKKVAVFENNYRFVGGGFKEFEFDILESNPKLKREHDADTT